MLFLFTANYAPSFIINAPSLFTATAHLGLAGLPVLFAFLTTDWQMTL
jgi:hypothetical protein